MGVRSVAPGQYVPDQLNWPTLLRPASATLSGPPRASWYACRSSCLPLHWSCAWRTFPDESCLVIKDCEIVKDSGKSLTIWQLVLPRKSQYHISFHECTPFFFALGTYRYPLAVNGNRYISLLAPSLKLKTSCCLMRGTVQKSLPCLYRAQFPRSWNPKETDLLCRVLQSRSGRPAWH